MKTADKIKLVALRHKIAAGIHDLACGRFQTYNSSTLSQLVNEIGRHGRNRLHRLRLKVAAKVHEKRK